jgi:Zn-dependent protease
LRIGKVRVGCGALLAAAAVVFFGGLRALAVILAAAAAHEAGHLIALALLGAPAREIRLGALGAVMEADVSRLGFGAEAVAAAAGPAAGILLALAAARSCPELAGTSAALSALNLLPCGSLDGGRILRAGLSAFLGADATEKAVTAVTCVCAACFAGLAILARSPAASVTLLAASVWSAAGLTERGAGI